MDLGEVIRRRRVELGLSQADVAKKAGVDARQIRRYEAGEQQPVFPVAVAIAAALDLPLADLAGIPEHRINLSGDWFAGWQSFKDGEEVVAVQPVRLRQQGELIQIESLERGRPIEDGGYLWRGELRLWDNEDLMGWYASTDPTVRSRGTFFFTLHTQGQIMTGIWTGRTYDSKHAIGRAGIARNEPAARAAAGNLESIPAEE
jgi:transcriptional regulator with XRE-family HTH domain